MAVRESTERRRPLKRDSDALPFSRCSRLPDDSESLLSADGAFDPGRWWGSFDHESRTRLDLAGRLLLLAATKLLATRPPMPTGGIRSSDEVDNVDDEPFLVADSERTADSRGNAGRGDSEQFPMTAGYLLPAADDDDEATSRLQVFL